MQNSQLMKLIGLLLAIFLLANSAYSQSPDTRKGPSTTPTLSKPSTKAEIQQRRGRARSLLVSLSTDAQSFRDQTLRARSLARIADALWQVDVDQARLLFRKAWEAAEVADQDSNKKLQEEINNQKTRTGSFAITFPPNIRSEVLKLTARHDRAMAEDFLTKLISAKGDVPNSATTRRDPLSDRPDEATSQRLAVANELLKADDTERALQFAAPALAVVSPGTIDFLSDLREKNPTLADSAYLALLHSSLNEPRSDANTVSLLASYIFTPHMFMTFSGAGASMSQKDSPVTPATVTPELRATFFQSAATILLRPLPSPDQLDQTSLGIDGKYLVIKRLLPFFEQFASAELVDNLRGHLNALAANVSNNARRREDDWISRGIKPDKPTAEREQELLDRIERVKTSAERDVLYLQLAFMLSMQGDVRARDITAKVENPETRNQAQAFVDSSLANYFVDKKLPDAALDLVHKGDLTRPHKSWILAQCAKIVAKTDTAKALELINDATDEARRIEPSDSALPRALLAVANALKLVDITRVWDATFDAVKAANSAEGFTGEDGQFIFRFQSRAQNSISNKRVPDFDLEPLFRDLTMLDYDRSVELARGFQAEGPRAIATIAIARAVLSPKNTVAPR
jgi:hypothetical protein